MDRLEVMLRAHVPVIHIADGDVVHAARAVKALGDDLKHRVITTSPVKPAMGRGGDIVSQFEGMKSLMNDPSPIVVIATGYGSLASQDSPAGAKVRDSIRLCFVEKPHATLVMIDPTWEPSADLACYTLTADLPLPNRDEITKRLQARNVEASAERVEALRGLSPTGLDTIIACAVTAKETGAEALGKEKARALMHSAAVEPLDTSGLPAVGGHEHLLRWVRNRQRAFLPEAAKYGVDPPRGLLCAGPPGVGKSLIAKHIGHMWGLPSVRLDLSRIFGRFVGESEAKLRLALNTLDALSPCVAFIDEIEKAVAGHSGGGDSGVTARLLGGLLTWQQEQSNVFVVATCNRVEQLPPELTRKGRFDATFYLQLPIPVEAAQILKIHLDRRGLPMDPTDIAHVVETLNREDLSGAELEQAVKDAALQAYEYGTPGKPTKEELGDALAEMKPVAYDADAHAQWAQVHATFSR